MKMIGHQDSRENRPIAQLRRGFLQPEEGALIREHRLSSFHTNRHKINDRFIPTEPDRNPGRMTHIVLDCRASAPLAEAKTQNARSVASGALALQNKEKNAARVT